MAPTAALCIYLDHWRSVLLCCLFQMFHLLLLLGALSWAAWGVHRVCGESRGRHHRNVQLPPAHQVQRVRCQRKYLWKSGRWAPRSHIWRMSSIVSSGGCVESAVMFCEWTESESLWQRRGDQAIQSWSALAAALRDSLSPLCLHLLAPLSFLSLHLPLPWLWWFQRGCRTVAPSLSHSLYLYVCFQHLNRETSFVNHRHFPP